MNIEEKRPGPVQEMLEALDELMEVAWLHGWLTTTADELEVEELHAAGCGPELLAVLIERTEGRDLKNKWAYVEQMYENEIKVQPSTRAAQLAAKYGPVERARRQKRFGAR
jgi:hypothetical protein